MKSGIAALSQSLTPTPWHLPGKDGATQLIQQRLFEQHLWWLTLLSLRVARMPVRSKSASPSRWQAIRKSYYSIRTSVSVSVTAFAVRAATVAEVRDGGRRLRLHWTAATAGASPPPVRRPPTVRALLSATGAAI